MYLFYIFILQVKFNTISTIFALRKISATGFNSGVKATVAANAALDRENLDTEEEHQMVFFLILMKLGG
jgi:hypothetical protein